MSDISISPVITWSTWDHVQCCDWRLRFTSPVQNLHRRTIRVDVSICCRELPPSSPSFTERVKEERAPSLWNSSHPKSEKAASSSCASSPSHLSWSLCEHMAWEPRKCSISAGWIRNGVTGCKGVVMGTLAGARRNLPRQGRAQMLGQAGRLTPR